jgi:hypothetical protein
MPVLARVTMKVGYVGAIALNQVVAPQIKDASDNNRARENRSHRYPHSG